MIAKRGSIFLVDLRCFLSKSMAAMDVWYAVGCPTASICTYPVQRDFNEYGSLKIKLILRLDTVKFDRASEDFVIHVVSCGLVGAEFGFG